MTKYRDGAPVQAGASRFRGKAWLLLTVPFGFTTFAAFLYIGIRAGAPGGWPGPPCTPPRWPAFWCWMGPTTRTPPRWAWLRCWRWAPGSVAACTPWW